MDKKTDTGSYYQQRAKALSIDALDWEKRKFYLVGVALSHVSRR